MNDKQDMPIVALKKIDSVMAAKEKIQNIHL